MRADIDGALRWLCVPPRARNLTADNVVEGSDGARHNDKFVSPRGKQALRYMLAKE